VRHTPGGPWRLVLVSLKDDAATMERLHGLLVGLTGSDRLHLKFLVGDERFYTAEERRAAIRLPVVLFADLDEASARTLEAAFVAGGLDVVASRRLSGRQILRRPRPELIPTFAMAGMVVVDAAVRMHGTAMWVVFGAGALMATGVAAVPMGAARTLRKSRPRFRLADRGASIPESDALLAAAVDAARRLAAPEVRALFAQTAAALYRLARRAEGEDAPGARRLLDAAAPLVPRIAALADRLDALDRALGDGTDGELARALAQLERRLAVAPPADRPALEATRSDLEAALDRRAAAEDERARLATWLCALLSGLEDFARRGLALDDRIEAEALEAATRELEAALAPAEPDSARRA
jgi:hypothetical protein